jgi:hypothetical protein
MFFYVDIRHSTETRKKKFYSKFRKDSSSLMVNYFLKTNFIGSEWNDVSMEAKELICYMVTNIDVRYTPK